MKASTLLSVWRNSDVRLMLFTTTLLRPFYRLCFLAAASSHGVIAALASGPRSFESLAAEFGGDPEHEDGFRAWLEVGVRLGELKEVPEGYALDGFFSRRLAQEGHDAIAAWLEEAATLHRKLLLETPRRLRRKQPFTLADLDGVVVARSSRIVEPFVNESVAQTLPADRPVRLLEVGCDSGIYIRRAAQLNPQLTALGLELLPAVAEEARQNLERWGLADRASVEVGDIRQRTPEAAYDLVTLHNNIYYFPVAERRELLAHLRGFLRPGGRLLITTACQGGTVATELINLWAAATEGCGRLPNPEELVAQLNAAGFQTEPPLRLIPREAFFAFTGIREAPN